MTSSTPGRTRSHVSLETQDLARSSAFYRALFGAGPVLEKPDYVRFEPTEPGLVLGLDLRGPERAGPVGGATGALQHLGLLFPDAERLAAARARLAAAGFESPGTERTECCYAELAQYWATDPSGVRWELFLAHQELVESPSRSGTAATCCASSCGS